MRRRSPGLQDDLHVQRRAGIEPGAELRLERQVAQRCRAGPSNRCGR